MINRITLVGNLGKDPEFKEGDNYKYAKFGLATSESYKDKSGEWVNQTEWHNVVVWGALAEYCNKYLKKGDQIYLEGMVKTQEKDGKYYTSVVLNGYRAFIRKLSKDDKSESVKRDDVPKTDSWYKKEDEEKKSMGPVDDWGRDLPF